MTMDDDNESAATEEVSPQMQILLDVLSDAAADIRAGRPTVAERK
jgi:hypothetical protein